MEGFTFWRSYYETMRKADAETVKALLLAMGGYMFDDEEPDLDGITALLFEAFRGNLDKSKARSTAGKKSGATRREMASAAEQKRTNAEQTLNKNEQTVNTKNKKQKTNNEKQKTKNKDEEQKNSLLPRKEDYDQELLTINGEDGNDPLSEDGGGAWSEMINGLISGEDDAAVHAVLDGVPSAYRPPGADEWNRLRDERTAALRAVPDG